MASSPLAERRARLDNLVAAQSRAANPDVQQRLRNWWIVVAAQPLAMAPPPATRQAIVRALHPRPWHRERWAAWWREYGVSTRLVNNRTWLVFRLPEWVRTCRQR